MIWQPTVFRFLVMAMILCCLLPSSASAAPASEDERLFYWDLTPLFSLNFRNPDHLRRFYDTAHFAASLQGLVNRDRPRLFIRYHREPDDFWWNFMTRPGGWLANRKVVTIRRAEELVPYFRQQIKGAVVWDERVPATSNVASTVAGCQDLVCLRYDESPESLYYRMVIGPPRLPVVVRLIGDDGDPMFVGDGIIPGAGLISTGSAKCDAYLWAIRHCIERGNSDPRRMGYYLDGFWLKSWQASELQNHTLTNHDYVIAHRGFVFDLGVWDDEVPIDDPHQKPGTDANTLRAILSAAYKKVGRDAMIHIAGFVPWVYKYTNHRSRVGSAGGTHEPTATEWKFAEIISCFNAFMDADALQYASMANASFFQHFPLDERYPQNPRPVLSQMRQQGFIGRDGRVAPKRYFAFYVGDYDSAAWLYHFVPKTWPDSKRGTIPLSWGFNPNLCERNPLAMVYTRETRTPNDFFVAGNSGAGYLNPGLLTPPRPHSKLPSGLETWKNHCKAFYRQWDITLTGFIIDGNGPGLSRAGLAAYADFSPDGIIAEKIDSKGVYGKMPFLKMGGILPGDPGEAARVILGRYGETRPQFLVFRSILQSPSWHTRVAELIRRESVNDPVEIVDLYTLLWLVGQHELGGRSASGTRTPYSGVRQVSCSPDSLQGIRPVYFVDGPHYVAEVAGRKVWRVPAHDPPYYLYLEVDDGFFSHARVPLEVRVTYLDKGKADLSIQYDSFDARAPHQGIYKSPSPHQRTDSGQWKTAAWRLEDARFGNLQNADCDLRIFTGGNELVISEVVIEKVP